MDDKPYSLIESALFIIVGWCLGYYVIGPWIWETFYKNKYDDDNEVSLRVSPITVCGNALSAKEKACIAVGLCAPEENFVILEEDEQSWKQKIIDNAEKIFSKEKPVSKKNKKTSKRK